MFNYDEAEAVVDRLVVELTNVYPMPEGEQDLTYRQFCFLDRMEQIKDACKRESVDIQFVIVSSNEDILAEIEPISELLDLEFEFQMDGNQKYFETYSIVINSLNIGYPFFIGLGMTCEMPISGAEWETRWVFQAKDGMPPKEAIAAAKMLIQFALRTNCLNPLEFLCLIEVRAQYVITHTAIYGGKGHTMWRSVIQAQCEHGEWDSVFGAWDGVPSDPWWFKPEMSYVDFITEAKAMGLEIGKLGEPETMIAEDLNIPFGTPMIVLDTQALKGYKFTDTTRQLSRMASQVHNFASQHNLCLKKVRVVMIPMPK